MVRKIRGLSIKFYLFIAAFSGASSYYYIFKPVVDILEQRKLQLERESALSTIKAAEGKEKP